MPTTIPPLGLSPGDPREKVREQVNADIAAIYTDLADAIRNALNFAPKITP